MLPTLTTEEITLLEKTPEGAAIAKKLKDGNFVPYERFKEINDKAKESADALKKFEDDQKKAEEERLKKQGEFQKLAEDNEKKAKEFEEKFGAEKLEADKFRTFRAAKIEEYKKVLGDDWLPEYENFSLESLDKIMAKHIISKDGDPSKLHPGKGGPEFYTKAEMDKMTPDEIRANLEKVNKSLAHIPRS